MKEIIVGSGITSLPTAPTLNDGSAEALSAMADYEYVCTMRNLRANSYAINQMETTDLSDAETAMSGLSDYLKTWFDTNEGLSAAGDDVVALDKSYIPEIIQFVALAATGQWGLVFVLFVKVGFEFLLDAVEKKQDPDMATGDNTEILKKLFAVLDENGDIVGCRLDGLANLHITLSSPELDEDLTYTIGASAP